MLDKNRHKLFLQSILLVVGVFSVPFVVALLSWWWSMPLIIGICMYLQWIFDASWWTPNGDPDFLFIFCLLLCLLSLVQPLNLSVEDPPFLWDYLLDLYKMFFQYLNLI